jgi:hypothetical protein
MKTSSLPSVKTLGSLCLLLTALLVLPACKTKEQYAKNQAAGEVWLAEHKAPAKINIGGRWHSDDWGGAVFEQRGRAITGTIGEFNVQGVISGSKAYLTISERGWIYYTAILERSGNSLTGFYSYSVPFTFRDQRSIQLRPF